MNGRRGRIAAVLVMALSATGCASAAGPGWTYAPVPAASSGTGAPAASTTAPNASQPAAAAGEIAIDAFDLGFEPASIEVPAAGTYTVKFNNTGAVFHDVTFADGTRIEAEAGQMAEGQVTLPAEGAAFICSVPGHQQGGMTGEVKVAGSTAQSGDDHCGALPEDEVKADPYALVQSEWYLGEQGKQADLEKAMAAATAPDLVLFNGVANQYKDDPIEVPTNERVRVFVLNIGPSVDSSFHVVGTIFDRVIKEGIELTSDNPGGRGEPRRSISRPPRGPSWRWSSRRTGFTRS